MKKRLVSVLLALLLCAAFAAGVAEETATIVQSSCNIVQSGEYYLVHCYAQIRNNTDRLICMDEGMLSLINGEQLVATAEVSQLWPYFLGPGEEGYVFDIVAFEPNEDGIVVPTVTGLLYDIRYMTIDKAYDNLDLNITAEIVESDMPGEITVVCEIENPTQMDAYDPTVSFGLYAESGAMIYADGMTLQNIGVPAGGKTLVRFPVESVFVDQWRGYNAMPVRAEATAVFRNDTD